MSVVVEGLVASYYGDLDILNSIDLKAEKGRVTAVIGPNGAGKSTLLKTICGFLKPKKGSVVFDETEITGLDPYLLARKGLSFVPQRHTVFPNMTVEENLRLGAWIAAGNKTAVMKSINSVYEGFPVLKQKQNQPAGKMSGGQQRMLEMGRAIMNGPKTVLLDEPTAGLAPIVAKEIYEKVSELSHQGITILLVDQNVRQAVQMSDYVYVLSTGKIVIDGPRINFEQKMPEMIRDWLV